MKPIYGFFLIIIAAVGILLSSSLYTVGEWEQVIITQFGERVGDPLTDAGLKMKVPFVQEVNRIEKRFLEWDGSATQMPTRDKLFVIIDTFARWRISDPGLYLERLRDERSARSRLDDILGSETRTAVANHDLIEIIRTTKERQPAAAEDLVENVRFDNIRIGRPAVEQRIFEASKPKLAEFGIELLDIRFKRINYNPQVEAEIYQRMISERRQIAERFRSQGSGEAERIRGEMDQELNRIRSEAYREVQAISGTADARATEIYAAAYNRSPQAAEFYRFLKTMETYRTALGDDTTVILSTESPLFEYLSSGGSLLPATP